MKVNTKWQRSNKRFVEDRTEACRVWKVVTWTPDTFSTRLLRYKVPGTGHQEPAINPHAQRDAAHAMCIIVPIFLIVAHI